MNKLWDRIAREEKFEKFSLIWTVLFMVFTIPTIATYAYQVRVTSVSLEAARRYLLQNLPFEIGAVCAIAVMYILVLLVGRLIIVGRK